METRVGESNATINSSMNPSYTEALREIGSSTRDLVKSEIALIKAEMNLTAKNAGAHLGQAVAFGALLAISVLPFLAFLVIGLGQLMNGNYWLSSLIVAVVCAAVGGIMAYRAFNKLKNEDLKFERTRRSLGLEANVIQASVDDVKFAAKGERSEFDRLH